MKYILIIDDNSYIGSTVKSFLISRLPTKDDSNQYAVATLSVSTDEWRDLDFYRCDSVIYCTEITGSAEKEYTRDEYMKINCDLAYEAAEKCKKDRVSHFIYLSTIDVYGVHAKIGKEFVIKEDAPCRPRTLYAESKLAAEQKLSSLVDDNFKITIIRSPMIYGHGCPGDYNIFRSYALEGKPVPQATSQRSFLHIDNLCEYIKVFIDQETNGIFCPQNADIVTPLQLVETIAQHHEVTIRHQNALANATVKLNSSMNDLWGGMVYDRELSDLPELTYISFEDSIRKTEREQGE